MAYPSRERNTELQEQDAQSFNNALKIGKSVVTNLRPDPNSPQEMSELFLDLKVGAEAAGKMPGGLATKGIVGVGAAGLSRISRTVGKEIIDRIFGTRKIWDNGWKAVLPDGRTVDWGSKWWSTTLDTPLTATRFAVKTYDGLNQRMDKAYVKNKKLIKQKQGLPEPILHGDDILNNFLMM